VLIVTKLKIRLIKAKKDSIPAKLFKGGHISLKTQNFRAKTILKLENNDYTPLIYIL
jgi:hypothetical protein